jgi:type IV pilus assembly protein PilE
MWANNYMGRSKGFTLVELMIVVVIMGVLSAVIYPSYVEYVARGARGDALSGIMRVANLQEQYYLDHRSFETDMTKLGLAADPFIVDNKLYQVDSTVVGGNYTVTATAVGIQASRDAVCKTISLTSAGAKTPSECW